MEVKESGNVQFDIDQLNWKKATAKKMKGNILSKGDALQFQFSTDIASGQLESKGEFSWTSQQKILQADWVVSSIEIETLLESFSNFDQRFITSEHLSGKADVWVETTIPMNSQWKILTNQVKVKSAVEIRDGRLKNLSMLEQFSDYIHVDDLRDIRFNQLRNYLKIENGQVYLPVMFIQSSAVNLSISGVHGFDQKILYNLKLNAGQTIANKLKRSDVRKEFVAARKSGWINMYFVLEGTTSDVRYQQYRTAVISGFEQSAKLKEELRNYLVGRFGYDVHWLEPNEWEEIPEYK
jgi:hypothetical protein